MKYFSGLLFLTIMYLPQVKADLSRGVFTHFNWVQERMSGGPRCVEGSSMTSTERNDIAELCMTQMCGPSTEVTDTTELALSLMKDPNFKQEAVKTVKEAIHGINRFIDEAEKEKRLTVEAYNELKGRDDLEPSGQFSRLHDLTAMLNEIRRAAYKAGPSRDLPIVLDKEGSRENLNDLTDTHREWAINTLDHFIRSPKGSRLMLQSITQPRNFFLIKYPSLSFQEALKQEAVDVKKIANDLLNGPQGSTIKMIAGASDTLTDPVIQKAINGESMTDSEVAQFMTVSASVPLFWDVLTPRNKGGQTVLTSEPSKEKLSEFLSRTQFDQQIRTYQADLNNTDKYQKAREAIYQSCYTNYIFQLATLPSKMQLAQAQSNGTWAKGKIKDILKPIVSDQTKRSLGSTIDNSFFAYPRDKESFHKFFVDQINAAANDLRNVARDYRNLIDTGKHKPITLLNVHLDSDEYTLEKHFNNVTVFCEDFEIKMTSDNTFTSTGEIEFSWVTARKPNLGKSIMLHELGHIAYEHLNSDKSSQSSRGRMTSINQCLASNHPGGDALPAETYIEEDWSDLIASKGNPEAGTNIGCNLTYQENDKYTGFDLTNSESEDKHSTSFFRALHSIKAMKGSVPSACTQYLENEKSSWQFQSCF